MSALDKNASSKNDVLIVIDSTGSMGTYLTALRQSIPEILGLSKLSDAFTRVGIIAYKDYSDKDIIKWSGWNSDVAEFAETREASGGGDYPEAAKTALIKVIELATQPEPDRHRHTIVLWYADAPPHHPSQRGVNRHAEIRAFPPGRTDWVKLTREASEKRIHVFSFIPEKLSEADSSFYIHLSTKTGGACFATPTELSAPISRISLDVLLTYIGYPPSHSEASPPPYMAVFRKQKLSKKEPTNEVQNSYGCLPPVKVGKGQDIKTGDPLLGVVDETFTTLTKDRIGGLPPKELANRFQVEGNIEYRAAVYEGLGQLISHNPFCLTYNPIFGQLWRLIAKQPPNEPRDALIQLMQLQVLKMVDLGKRGELEAWLDMSYDSSAEIQTMIMEHKKGQQEGPHLFLDWDSGVKLSRKELLEITSDTYPNVLQRLTSALTHLKVIENPAVLSPNHRSVPLSLEPIKLFRLIPSLIVPGTLYSHRSACLLAALSLVLSIPFLQEPAIALVKDIRGKWLSYDTPEFISFETANLLLNTPTDVVLTAEEREVYEGMRRMALIERHLDDGIMAKVPWTPSKTRKVGDRKVTCKNCHIQRSVTLMSDQKPGVCGLCIQIKTRNGKTSSSFQDQGNLHSCWVECSVSTCRVLYVIEDAEALRVSPKCWYCRKGRACPSLECMGCHNKYIVPFSYRTPEDDEGSYKCPACVSAHSVAVVTEKRTTTRTLLRQNQYDTTFLGYHKHPSLFQGRSAIKLFQYGVEIFKYDPSLPAQALITLDLKRVVDTPALLSQVENMIGLGSAGFKITCHFCFRQFVEKSMVQACGRAGCKHQADDNCLKAWYTRNKPGQLFDFVHTTCAFCRQHPDSPTREKFQTQLGVEGAEQENVDSAWFYGWCATCGAIKPAVERAKVGSAGALSSVTHFECAGCKGGGSDVLVEVQ